MTDVEALEARIEELEAQTDRLETELTATKQETDDLQARVDELEAETQRLEADNEALRARIDELEAQPEIRIDDPTDPIGSLHILGAPVGQAITSKPGQTDLDAELDDLRAELKAITDEPPAEPTVEMETPLEQVVAMSNEMVGTQLTANQRRARFVAIDITEYATKTPGGWVLTPKDLRTVLNAAFDTGHSQTCSRVREILADLGNDEVEIKDSRGEQKLVFDEALVGRLVELQTTDHDVVTPTEV